jgi:hypothetical protein
MPAAETVVALSVTSEFTAAVAGTSRVVVVAGPVTCIAAKPMPSKKGASPL